VAPRAVERSERITAMTTAEVEGFFTTYLSWRFVL
jgi:hypothetical protein